MHQTVSHLIPAKIHIPSTLMSMPLSKAFLALYRDKDTQAASRTMYTLSTSTWMFPVMLGLQCVHDKSFRKWSIPFSACHGIDLALTKLIITKPCYIMCILVERSMPMAGGKEYKSVLLKSLLISLGYFGRSGLAFKTSSNCGSSNNYAVKMEFYKNTQEANENFASWLNKTQLCM